MKYRPHRGSLVDSMSEVIELHDRQALLDHLNKGLGFKKVKLEDKDLKLSKQGYDSRIDWDTHIVCIRNKLLGTVGNDELWYFGKAMGPNYFGAIGYTDKMC